MVTLRKILNLDQWPDLIAGPNGFAAKRRPDIAPMAYEIVINSPLSDEMIEKMIDYAGEADAGLTRDLFSLCNGIRVGATKFAVYGVRRNLIRDPAENGPNHLTLDINVPNIYGRPKGCSADCLIVGSSTEDGENQRDQEFFHAITPSGTVIVASEGDDFTVSRQYNTITEWLATEVRRALQDTTRF